MIERLQLHNFPSGHAPHLSDKGAFVLNTCQRTMVLSLKNNAILDDRNASFHWHYQASDAYIFMLETICGLKSKLLGENEIVGQFKAAFKQFLANPLRDNQLIVILEKLFKDAKDIRSQYLLGLSQKTYASITRKIISRNQAPERVLIIGSGHLSEDLINQFKKKADITVCARNMDKIAELKMQHDLNILDWSKLNNIHYYSHIANTVGFEGVLFNENFYQQWKSHHPDGIFVDLGSPSVVQTKLKKEHGVWRLEDIFTEGACHENYKWNQINLAKEAMKAVVQKRQLAFKKKMVTMHTIRQQDIMQGAGFAR